MVVQLIRKNIYIEYIVISKYSSNRNPMRETRSMSIRRSSNIYCDQPTCYYFLTQCWVEPQDGFVETNSPELEFLNQCTYKQIVDKVSFVV
jgi:hypothetical protein